MPEEFIIRPAEERDIKAVFELSNDALVRANSINTKLIEWESHVGWFQKMLKDENLIFYIAETAEGEFVGQMRFQKQNGEWVVSISIGEKFRGRKAGEYVLKKTMELSGLTEIHAYVKKENKASIGLFKNAGYKEVWTANEPFDNLLKFALIVESSRGKQLIVLFTLPLFCLYGRTDYGM